MGQEWGGPGRAPKAPRVLGGGGQGGADGSEGASGKRPGLQGRAGREMLYWLQQSGGQTHSLLHVVQPGCPHIPHRPGHPVTWTSSRLSGELFMDSPVYPHPGQQLPASHHPFAGLPPMLSEPVPWYSARVWLSGPHSPSPAPPFLPTPHCVSTWLLRQAPGGCRGAVAVGQSCSPPV